MNNLIGATIQHYQILVKVRETPTRTLYRAYDTKAHIYIALEVVKESRDKSSQLLNLINAQVQINAELSHANIATVTDIGLHENTIYIVYNFSPTHPLRRFFNRTYSWKEMARELVSITHALAYAHEKGVIHGFLNPSSIVLDDKRNPILFDFGFERIITDHILAHSPGAWLNRWGFEYLAPEQLIGANPDWRSDIYAMGMILHEWLTGKIAFVDSTVIDTMKIRMASTGIKNDKKTVSPLIQNLIQKCIESNPADRYQSMQEVYVILARGALDMSITKRMVRKPLAIVTQRFKTAPSLIALGILVIFAVISYFVITSSGLPAKGVASATTTPTKTLVPTLFVPTATSTPKAEAPTLSSPTQLPNIATLPLFQGISLASVVNQVIAPNNSSQIVMVSLWGVGDTNRLASSADGNHIATASTIGIFIFDAHSLKLEKYIDTRSWITAIDFSPDSKIIATGDRDGLIQLWNTDTWQEFETPYSGHTKTILDLAFSPDGSMLASVGLDNYLFQWHINSKEGSSPVRAQVMDVTAVAYSADGARIITGGNDFKINVWDAGTLTLAQTVVFSSKIVDIASAANRLVIGGSDQKVAIMDLSNNATLTSLGNLQYPLTSVAISPNGKVIAGGDLNGGITVWSVEGIQLQKSQNYVLGDPASLNMAGSPHSLAFSPDGKFIFSGLRNGTIRILDAITGEEVAANQSINTHSQKLVVSHNSKYAITQQADNWLTIWDVWNARILYQMRGEIKDGDPFSQDDSMFAIASSQTAVKVHQSASGTEIYTLNGHEDIKTIQFINDNAQLAAGNNQSMHLWSISSGQEVKIKKIFEGQGCSSIYDLNEQPIFSITEYQLILKRDQNSPILCNFQKLNWTISFNPNTGQIAYGGNSILTVVNSGTGESRNMNGVNRKNIVSVAISPKGDIVAAAFDDNTIHLWNISTREEMFSLFGHSNLITALRFTPDGKILISASLDGTLRIWGVP